MSCPRPKAAHGERKPNRRTSMPKSEMRTTSSYDPQPGDVPVTVVTALILLALLVFMVVL
jgi:hypothetical protein